MDIQSRELEILPMGSIGMAVLVAANLPVAAPDEWVPPTPVKEPGPNDPVDPVDPTDPVA